MEYKREVTIVVEHYARRNDGALRVALGGRRLEVVKIQDKYWKHGISM